MKHIMLLIIATFALVGCTQSSANRTLETQNRPFVVQADSKLVKAIKENLLKEYKFDVLPAITDTVELQQYRCVAFLADKSGIKYQGVAMCQRSKTGWDIIHTSYDIIDFKQKLTNIHVGFGPGLTNNYEIEIGYINTPEISSIKIEYPDGKTQTKQVYANQKTYMLVRQDYSKSISKIYATNKVGKVIFSKEYIAPRN